MNINNRRRYNLIKEIRKGELPLHVAVIMDGNGRWAERHGLKRIEGHKRARRTVRMFVKTSYQLGIKYLTLYAFSTENWNRPEEEVAALLKLLSKSIDKEKEELNAKGVRLKFIGRINELPKDLQSKIVAAEKLTKDNERLIVTIAINYGARSELVDAVRRIVSNFVINEPLITKKTLIRTIPSLITYTPENFVTEQLITEHLYTGDLPDVDLLIRTGGELRLSNFLLWQVAYAELYFTKKLFPEFTKMDYLEAVRNYQRRERRFGQII